MADTFAIAIPLLGVASAVLAVLLSTVLLIRSNKQREQTREYHLQHLREVEAELRRTKARLAEKTHIPTEAKDKDANVGYPKS